MKSRAKPEDISVFVENDGIELLVEALREANRESI